MKNMTLAQAIEAENKATSSLMLAKKEVLKIVGAAENLGTDTSASGMLCTIVPLETVLRVRSLQMESYLPVEQAKLVGLKVGDCRTASSLMKMLFSMVRDGKVDIGEKVYALNPGTVVALDDYLRVQLGVKGSAEKQLG